MAKLNQVGIPRTLHVHIPLFATAPGVHKGYSAGALPGSITGVSYSSGMASGMSSTGLTLAPPKNPVMMMAWVNNEPQLKFYGEEHGNDVEATFAPEFDISTQEFMKVSLLQTFVMIAAGSSSVNSALASVKPIEYLRSNNLLRHFKVRVV